MENILHRKEGLIISTIDIIDELGIQGLSTREIAKRQNVSEATIFRHYKSKNELLAAVLDFYSKFDDDIYQTTRIKKLSPKDSILFLVKSFAEYYENYPAITSVMQIFEVLRYEPELNPKVKNILDSRATHFQKLVEKAQQSGDIRVKTGSSIIAVMITGIIRENCLRWRLKNKEYSLKNEILGAVEMLLTEFS